LCYVLVVVDLVVSTRETEMMLRLLSSHVCIVNGEYSWNPVFTVM